MTTVHKYPFRVADSFTLKLPRNAILLHAECQPPDRGTPCLWAWVDPSQPEESVEFCVVGTGNPVPDGFFHVATFQQLPFVWHLFRKGGPR